MSDGRAGHKQGCTSKRRYASAEQAVASAGRLVRRFGACRPYACRHCHGWHLTTQTRARPLALLAALTLSACGAVDVARVRDPFGPVIGMSDADLFSTLGKPSDVQRSGPDTAALTWRRNDTTTALRVTVPLLGSVEAGGGGGCELVVTIDRRKVLTVAFPGAYQDSLFAVPYAACGPLIHELIAHPNDTGERPRDYDAFRYLALADGKGS